MKSNIKACTVCFSYNIKLYSLDVGTFRNDFLMISGLEKESRHGMPDYLCVECLAYVNKFKQFRDKCRRAYYVMKAMLTHNKNLNNLKSVDRKQLKVMPYLSYMGVVHINFLNEALNELDDSGSKNTPKYDLTDTLIAQESTVTKEHTGEIKKEQVKNTKTEKRTAIELEQTIPMEVNDSEATDIADQNIPTNFSDSCKLTNALDRSSSSCEYKEVVAISVKEAQAVVAVNKFCSVGDHQCSCGWRFGTEKAYKNHIFRHDLQKNGPFHCEICDYYYKNSSLLQSHMTNMHMYKYICKNCPEVSFSNTAANQHYFRYHNKQNIQICEDEDNFTLSELKTITSTQNMIMGRTTMGELANWEPIPKEKEFFLRFVKLLDDFYPKNWRDWEVNNVAYEEIFGNKRSNDDERHVRFGVPTVEMVRIFLGNSNCLVTVQRYKKIKMTVLKWPLGRAVLCRPHSVIRMIHSTKSFDQFWSTINKLKPRFLSRQDANKELKKSQTSSSSLQQD